MPPVLARNTSGRSAAEECPSRLARVRPVHTHYCIGALLPAGQGPPRRRVLGVGQGAPLRQRWACQVSGRRLDGTWGRRRGAPATVKWVPVYLGVISASPQWRAGMNCSPSVRARPGRRRGGAPRPPHDPRGAPPEARRGYHHPGARRPACRADGSRLAVRGATGASPNPARNTSGPFPHRFHRAAAAATPKLAGSSMGVAVVMAAWTALAFI